METRENPRKRELLDWARSRRTGSVTSKAVFVALARVSGDHGQSREGARTLAAQCECTHDTVSRCIQRLVQMGLVASIPQFDADGTRLANCIVLLKSGRERDYAKSLGWQPDTACGAPGELAEKRS